jgi:5-methylcytosine-specific restriction endonuclease McrA
MPYKNPKDRNSKHEYQMELKRGDDKKQLERQKARQLYDRLGIDRKGKDIDHIKPLSKGGKTSRSNLRLESPHKNRSYARNSDHSIKK